MFGRARFLGAHDTAGLGRPKHEIKHEISSCGETTPPQRTNLVGDQKGGPLPSTTDTDYKNPALSDKAIYLRNQSGTRAPSSPQKWDGKREKKKTGLMMV